MVTVSTYDAKASLSALLQQVEAGEDIVITRHGTPVARLVRYEAPAWTPFCGPVPNDLRIRDLSEEEAVAPLYPEGFPLRDNDPV